MTNPHLPSKRKQEADLKRRAFKDHLELTLDLEQKNSEPINKILYQINKEGKKYIEKATERELETENQTIYSRRVDHLFFDCSDGIGCE